VTANAVVILVGSHHHRHRIPADDVLDATLHLPITREFHLIGMVNCIDIRSVRREWQFHAASVGAFLKTPAVREMIFTVAMKDVFQRLVPFIEFFRSNPRNLILNMPDPTFVSPEMNSANRSNDRF
jgi:hypothetical protein